MRSIADAPREPGKPIMTNIGVVGWAQELEKTPPPFLDRVKIQSWVPEISREGGWRRMAYTEVFGWAYLSPMDIVNPTVWSPL